MGETIAELLAAHYGDLDPLLAASQEELTEIEGVGPIIAESVVRFFADARNRAEGSELREDWELFAQMIAMGELTQLNGRIGKVLQLRPKAANRHSTTWALDEAADWVRVLPRGFYLRPAFTGAIFARELLLPE